MTTLLVYSEDQAVREQVRLAVGRRPAADLDPVDYLEAAEGPTVVRAVDEHRADILVLDGEAWPTGGMGICRELKNSRTDCPPVVVLTARVQDEWLARWSQADGVALQPVDAVTLAQTVVRLLRERAAAQVLPAAGAAVRRH